MNSFSIKVTFKILSFIYDISINFSVFRTCKQRRFTISDDSKHFIWTLSKISYENNNASQRVKL